MLFQSISEYFCLYRFHIQFLVGSRMLFIIWIPHLLLKLEKTNVTSKVQHEHKSLYNTKCLLQQKALCYKLKVSHITVAI